MKQEKLLTKLYHLITSADGLADEKETEIGQKIILHEGLDEGFFFNELEQLKLQSDDVIYQDCVDEMQMLDVEKRVHFIAWMIILANADGFMDEREWQLIYKLYHKDLKVKLSDIMQKQKELNYLMRGTTKRFRSVDEKY